MFSLTSLLSKTKDIQYFFSLYAGYKVIEMLLFSLPDCPEGSNGCYRIPHLNEIRLKEAK